jgi:trk system potassium uptake protein TrkH
VAYYTGMVLWGVAGIMVVPAIISLASREFDVMPGFLASAGLSLLLGSICVGFAGRPQGRMSWGHGMLVVAVSWLVAMVVCAVPSWLSGQYISFVDACFDVMSGFTTTGLILIQDLDHVSDGMNTWRHLLSYVGGQGMIVLALSFLTKSFPGIQRLYASEGKDERLSPSIAGTARLIWRISLWYLVVGTAVLTVGAWSSGISGYRGFLHGLWVFLAAWSTGGFAPQTQSIIFYHSGLFEALTMVFFVLGSLNFGLHHAVWQGNRAEVRRNLEVQAFVATSVGLTLTALFALSRIDLYSSTASLFRRGVYQLISAHTTTGFMTIYPTQLIWQWGPLSLLTLVFAQLIGGSASSTAGGFKGIRVGLAVKAIGQEIRRLLLPESAVIVTRFHFFKNSVLEDRQTRSALLIIGLYILTFSLTAVANVASGYALDVSLFEAASVTGNVGLSAGLTGVAMPTALKLWYILVMWVGRLEFMAVLVFIGYVLRPRRTVR